MKNPQTGLHEKVVGYQFGQKIDVRDPHTGEVDRKPLKPFMVNTSVNVFEKEKIILNPEDSILVEQIKAYHIVSRSSSGLPVYSSENEHALDALNLCLLVFEQKYGELMKRIFSTKIIPFETIDQYSGRTQSRALSISKWELLLRLHRLVVEIFMLKIIRKPPGLGRVLLEGVVFNVGREKEKLVR